MGQNLFKKFNGLAQSIDVSTFLKAKNYLIEQGFEYKKFTNLDEVGRNELTGIGLYIFEFTFEPPRFDELWTAHKSKATKLGVRVSPLNENGSSEVMYVGKTEKATLKKRLKKHFKGMETSKKTGSMKLGVEMIENSELAYEFHVFEIAKEIVMGEQVINFMERILHEQLQPRIGKA